MPDYKYLNQQNAAPAMGAAVVTPNDSTDLTVSPTRSLWIGGAGTEGVIKVGAATVDVTGALSTTDPSGGAGPAWKFGVAASVSPTSPNRTLRVDIGGTSYYIHAKTTND